MDGLTPEQARLRDRARELAREAAAQAAETDRSGAYPWPMVRRMAEAGFTGLTVPHAWGGPGGDYFDAALVIEALNRALGHRLVEPAQLLIHTDQGSQYRANDYRELLQKEKITCSMSAKGCCWDNAVVESFFSTLKHEPGLDDAAEILNSPQQLIRQMAFWIDGYYNRERRHSTIGYLSPIDYEQQFINTRTLKLVGP